jgi:ubiquinone/menaquinone biosynthesis C-methylase UbiE
VTNLLAPTTRGDRQNRDLTSHEEAIRVSQPITFETYGGSAPENYEKYFVPAIGAPLATDLVDLAAPTSGERVLDLACGTGVVARLAARRVGPDGTVTGIDINPGMLAVARAASPEAGIQWHEASADQLPCTDESIDVVLCSLGAPFFPDRPAALRDARRVLVPGGRLALNAPGPIPPIFAILEEAIARHAGPSAARFIRTVFSLDDAAAIREALSTAGFSDVDTTPTTRTLHLPTPREFLWQYVHSTPLAAAAASMDSEQRAALERDVVEGWQPLTTDGRLRLRLDLTIATTRR